jgi:hypothetical protein
MVYPLYKTNIAAFKLQMFYSVLSFQQEELTILRRNMGAVLFIKLKKIKFVEMHYTYILIVKMQDRFVTISQFRHSNGAILTQTNTMTKASATKQYLSIFMVSIKIS